MLCIFLHPPRGPHRAKPRSMKWMVKTARSLRARARTGRSQPEEDEHVVEEGEVHREAGEQGGQKGDREEGREGAVGVPRDAVRGREDAGHEHEERHPIEGQVGGDVGGPGDQVGRVHESRGADSAIWAGAHRYVNNPQLVLVGTRATTRARASPWARAPGGRAGTPTLGALPRRFSGPGTPAPPGGSIRHPGPCAGGASLNKGPPPGATTARP